jgi:DNA replication and repair protein RecF
MYVSRLSLYDFRNYHRLTLALDAGTTLIYGPNASGKTSLLEALFYLATTRSLRAGTDRELVHWGAQGEAGTLPFARLVAEVQQQTSSLRLEVIIQHRGEEAEAGRGTPQLRPRGSSHKLVRINGRTARAFDLVGRLRVVLFTPADLTLVSGSPGDRRRYLDITLSQIDPHYVRTLSQYNRLVQQRNSLLRSWRERRRPLRAIDSELEYWDRELTANGGYLLAERLRAMTDLNAIGGPLFCDITGGTQALEIHYQPSFDLGQATTADDLAQQFVGSLQRLRRDELQRGQTLIGPHRDDLLFTAGTINLGIYGSRGQQRSVALALKLAEARLMQNRTSETPVLLLDDVLSELDMQRRTHLLRAISQPRQQIVLTATDLGSFDAEFLQQITCLRVEDGRIYPLS